jgi:hypothetical protein
MNKKKDNDKKLTLSPQHVYDLIQAVPKLFDQAIAIEQALSINFSEIQHHAYQIISQSEEQHEEFLKDFDIWLLPIAKEILNEIRQDTEHLQMHLIEGLKNEQTIAKMDWIEHAKLWAGLYAKWQDKQALIQKVLFLASERASQLVDKDIQLVQDYQEQVLAQSAKQIQDVQRLEERLSQVTEETLQKFHHLKKRPDKLSITQVSDWLASLYTKRATYFDHLLWKIDSFAKDVIHVEDVHDPTHFLEMEGEIKFMEYEMSDIMASLPHLKDENEKMFVQVRLKGILEHLQQFDRENLPKEMKLKFAEIEKNIAKIEKQIKKT